MLNEAQQKALVHTEGPLLVLAGAGSGKTRVITEKIAYLQHRCQLNPETIYALTFTNKAANEMRMRLRRVMGNTQADSVKMSTFHVLGLNIIKKELRELALKPNFTLLDEADCISLLQSLSQRAKTMTKPEAYAIKNQISRWKSANVLPEEVSIKMSGVDQSMLNYYQLYQKQLSAYSAVDFDDLIMLPTRLLRDNAMVLERWRAKVAYLLVDEYQDTNHSQYELVSHLSKHHPRFTLVGDDDQSIYSWRGARPENIILLKADFPALEVIMLEENYRSTNAILKVANHLIKHNPHTYEKRLWSANVQGDKIQIVDADDDEDEASGVINDILAHRFKYQSPYSSYAILYRSNHQAVTFEKTLRLHKIPYKITGGPSFFSRMEIKDLLAYCRLIINVDDDSALLRVINTPRRGIGATTLKKIGEYTKLREISMYKALSEMGLRQSLPESQAQSLENFCRLINDFRQKQHHYAPAFLCREIVEQTHYCHWLKDEAQTREISEQRIENIDSFIDWLANLSNENAQNFAEAITTLTLLDKDRQAEDKTDNSVQLMTMHSAKGLEFDHVYVVGFEDGILPHAVSIDEGNVEEERRIAYVAITRAKKRLMISYARARKRHGKLMRAKVSRFLEELDQECLDIKALHKPTVEEQKSNNQQNLNRLKMMLNQKG